MTRISKQNYCDQVATLIRGQIRSGKLKSGDYVAETGVAEECGVSRGPVREALFILEGEGLLTGAPRGGKFVTILTPESIRDSYEVCALLEAAVATRLPEHADEEKIRDNLAKLLEKMRKAVESREAYEEHALLGSEFHEALLSASPNLMLRKLARNSSRIISKCLMYRHWRTLYTPEELYERHKKIYDAICTGEKAKIEGAIHEHYAESAERLARYCGETALRKNETRQKNDAAIASG